MKTPIRLLTFLSLATTGFAQSDIYWTGLLDRWGGGDQNGFSLTPGGTDYQKVSGGDFYHFHYDEANMTGEFMNCSMNRLGVTMLSLTLNGASPTTGFTFDTVGTNSDGVKLSGNVTVNGGDHMFNNSGVLNEQPNFIIMTSSLQWHVAADARLIWKIDIEGQTGNEGITKTGAGALILRSGADMRYTGNTAVNEGIFGGFAHLAGNLSFASGTRMQFLDSYTLTVAGSVTFAGPFGVADVLGLDTSVADDAYTLIEGSVDFTNIGNIGKANAYELAEGMIGYFQEGTSSLVLVIEGAPVPTTWADWPIVNEQGDVDTGSFMGWINISAAPWIWNYQYATYLYMPEALVTENGAWNYQPR